jgi:hypothetical protein
MIDGEDYNMKDLMDYLLGDIYPQLDGPWTREKAENLTADLITMGYETDVDEVYETIAEFIEQDSIQ